MRSKRVYVNMFNYVPREQAYKVILNDLIGCSGSEYIHPEKDSYGCIAIEDFDSDTQMEVAANFVLNHPDYDYCEYIDSDALGDILKEIALHPNADYLASNILQTIKNSLARNCNKQINKDIQENITAMAWEEFPDKMRANLEGESCA